jgi:uncharacterized membrane protein
MKAREFLNAVDDDQLIAAIHRAEARTGMSFRVHVSHQSAHDAVAAARRQLQRIKSHHGHQGHVLIFVAPESRTFALHGDEAVHAKVPPAEWTSLSEMLTTHFKNGDLTTGLVRAIDTLADRLKTTKSGV